MMVERIRRLEALARVLDPGPAERAALARAAVEYAESFLGSLDGAPAFRLSPEPAREIDRHPIGAGTVDLPTALGLLKRGVDDLGHNLPSGRYMGFIPGGPLYHSAVADFLTAVTNRFSGHSYGSPGSVRMENLLLRWLGALVGYSDTAAGNLASGGSLAHLGALVTAREAAGLRSKDYDRAVVYLSSQAHHSVDKGLRVAGLGECVRRLVPVDARHRMIASALEAAIVDDRRQGLRPWLVVATAGTTDTGAVDPLEEIGEISQRQGLWLHVDAAYGGFFALCEQGRRVLRGVERSDSIILDPHKGLFIPYGTGAVLVKDGARLRAAHGFEASYTQDALKAGMGDAPAQLSPELSRHSRGPRVWLPLVLLGTEPFAAALEEKLLLARHAHERLVGMEGFETGPPPDLSIVTLRCLPPRGDVDAFNARLIEAVQSDGRVYLSSTRLDGKFLIRMAILGFRTHLDDVDLALQVLEEKARSLRDSPA